MNRFRLICFGLMAICLAIFLGLSACSQPLINSNGDDSRKSANSTFEIRDSASSAQNISGSILLWHDLDVNTAEIRRTINTYQQINPNVNIVVEQIPKRELIKRFLQQFRAGLAPNLLLIDYDFMSKLIQAQTLVSIDPKNINTNDILPSALAQVTYKNKIYGLPGAVITQVLCYNKNRVDDSQVPEKLEDLVSQAAAGYSIGIPSSFEETFWGIQLFGSEVFDAQGNFVLKRGSWVAWMTWLQSLKNQPKIILSSSINALNQSFKGGHLDYLVCDSTSIPDFKKALKNNNLGVTVLPAYGQNLAGPILYTKVLAITNSFSPRQTAIALDFARFVTNKQQQKQRAMDLGAFILPDKTVILDKRLFPIEAILEQQARSAVGIPLDHIPKAEIVFPIAESLYEQILAGAISPQEGGIELLKLAHQSSKKTQ